MRFACCLLLALLAGAPLAAAQDKGSVNPKPLPPLAHPEDPATPAKERFGRASGPALSMAARSIGFYSRGCLAGAQALSVNGEAWQAMRLSRNRNWGHPELVTLLEGLAKQVSRSTAWKGLLIGDMSQPRGGPMITGHASHQIGLDADIWLTPMPARTLSRAEREEMSAIDMVRPDRLDIDPAVWTPEHLKVIRLAAIQPRVERIFVNAAIKKALCREAGADRSWLSKVRPMYGHNYHFHVRITCPADAPDCRPQEPPVKGDGCGDLDWWFSDEVLHPKPNPNWKPPPPLTMAQLPAECRQVLVAK